MQAAPQLPLAKFDNIMNTVLFGNNQIEGRIMYKKNIKGFSLIELMTVVAVIGILAAIAYPSYIDSVRKSNRADGKALLADAMQRQERYYTQNMKYITDLKGIGYSLSTDVKSEEGFYTLSAAACAGSTINQCVQLTATATGSQAADGNLTINSRGQKTPPEKW